MLTIPPPWPLASPASCGRSTVGFYPNGLNDYMAALSAFLVDGQRLTPVMNAAGLSPADWYRHMLTALP